MKRSSTCPAYGFTLIEVSIALIITALVAAVLLRNSLDESKRSLGSIQADQLLQLGDAVDSYANLYRRELTAAGQLDLDFNNDSIIDFSVPENPPPGSTEGGKLTPTVQQLISAGVLSSSFQNRPVASAGQFIVRLQKLPSNCSSAANNCRVDGYVAISSPIASTNQNISAGEYDGKVISGILSNGNSRIFASLQTGQYPITSGGGQVLIDLNNNGIGDLQAGDIGVRAGTVGMIVGSTATRFTAVDPIAGVDYCPGNQTISWRNTSTAAGGELCTATIFADTPTGLSFIADDTDGQGNQGQGRISIQCVFNPVTGLASLSLKTRCCVNSSNSCNPTNS